MERVTDWIALWRELQEAQARSWGTDKTRAPEDVWREKARSFAAAVTRRWSTPDSSRGTVAAWLDAHPGSSVVDVGAGTGLLAFVAACHGAALTWGVDRDPAAVEAIRLDSAGCQTLAAAFVVKDTP